MYKAKRQKKLQRHHIKYAVLNKTDNTIVIYHRQKAIAELIGVNRKTIQRNVTLNKAYHTKEYAVYLIKDIKY